MSHPIAELPISTDEILKRASRRQGNYEGNALSALTTAACQAGIDPGHVVAAVAEVLCERARPRPVSTARRVFGRILFGAGAGAVMFWQSIHGAPGEVLIHMAALALVWAGLRLDRPSPRRWESGS